MDRTRTARTWAPGRGWRATAAIALLVLIGALATVHVDVAHAGLPISIDPQLAEGEDPLLQQGGKLVGAEEEGEAHFGASAALSGDGSTALIGGPQDGLGRGAVWVFARSESKSGWEQQGSKLVSSEPASEAGEEQCAEEDPEEAGECAFGSAVALSADGSTALIGDPSPGEQRGSAAVFTRAGADSTWSQTALLTGLRARGEGRFGRSVALSADGNTALIGDPSAGDLHGRALVFARNGSEWSLQASITDAEGSRLAQFGRSVALSADGGTAIIGGPGDSGNAGAAWVFVRSGSSWVQEPSKLIGAGEVGQGRFGESVALSGDSDTALVGGRADEGGRGAVWTFARSGNSFLAEGEKLAGAPQGTPQFGYSLALSNDGRSALVGAPRQEEGLGMVTVLTRTASGWSARMGLGGSEARGKVRSGTSVALSAEADVALVGGPRDQTRTGAAWLFAEALLSSEPAPTVSEVTPSHGPTTGGTTVMISGSNFVASEAEPPVVRFGSTPATQVQVLNAVRLKVTAPAEPEGTVDVTVQTAAGTSPHSAGDEFRFEAPTNGGKAKEGKGSGGSNPSGQSNTTGGGSGTPTIGGAIGGAIGGVAGSTSLASPACHVTLRSRRLVVALKRIASIRLLRSGSGQCRGTLTLRYKQKTRGKHFKLKTIGSARFAIAPGKSEVVRVALNKLGRALFRAGHGKLNASAAVVRMTPAPALASSASVRLSVKKTPKKTSAKK